MSDLEIETARVFLPLLADSRYKAIWGGRGSGKSHERAEALIEKAVMQHGLRWVCIREVQKSLKQSVKQLLADKIRKFGLSDMFEVTETQIRTPGNGIIIFQGMQNHTADTIKSLEGFDGAWVEEAQTLSQRSLDLLRPTIRKEGSELWFTWNPRFKTDAVDAFFRSEDGPPPGAIVVKANYDDNPWFPNVLREEMEYDKRRDPDKYAHIWLGDYQKNSKSRVFNNWTIQEFEAPADAVHRFGADWGFSNDPTVCVRCHSIGRKLYIDYEVYKIGCEIVDTPELFMEIPEAEKWPMRADSARPETISHMRKHGFPKIVGATKGPGSIVEGINFLKSFDIIVHPRCVHTADELALYSYKVDKDTDEVLPILEDKKNNVIDSIRYAFEGIMRAQKAKEPKHTGPVVMKTSNRW